MVRIGNDLIFVVNSCPFTRIAFKLKSFGLYYFYYDKSTPHIGEVSIQSNLLSIRYDRFCVALGCRGHSKKKNLYNKVWRKIFFGEQFSKLL